MANVVWAFGQLLVRHEPFLEAVAAKGPRWDAAFEPCQ